MDAQTLLKQLRETKYVVLRHEPGLYEFFREIDVKHEGMWYERTNVLGVHVGYVINLYPTDRFEFRDDGAWAQVYEIRTNRDAYL